MSIADEVSRAETICRILCLASVASLPLTASVEQSSCKSSSVTFLTLPVLEITENVTFLTLHTHPCELFTTLMNILYFVITILLFLCMYYDAHANGSLTWAYREAD